MTTNAAKATSFYSSFTSSLASLEASVSSAQSSKDFDAALAGIVDARSTLKEKDLEGLLTNRDKEQYEKKLRALQDSLNEKRSNSSSSTTFSFRRPAKPAAPKPPRSNPLPPNNVSRMTSSSSHSVPEVPSADVQVTLQSQRILTFQDLSRAASTSENADGLSLSLSHLSQCIIDFREAPRAVLALHANNLKSCVLLLPEIKGSVLLSGLEGSVVSIKGCGQFRIYGSKRTTIFVNASSAVTLEACSSLDITSLGQGELGAVGSDPADTASSADVEVQDFDAPGAGAVTTGSSSWKRPSDSDRAAVLARLSSLIQKARADSSSQTWLQDLAGVQGPPELFRKEDAGILLVYSDPGKDSTLEEFQDWYDNEHVPLRTLAFTEFRSAGRYEVYQSSHASSDSPVFKAGWSALYTISDNTMYPNPAYSGLRSNRSPREAALVVRLGVLDRRILVLKADSASEQPKGDIRPRTQAEVEKESLSISHLGFNVDKPEAEVLKWFKETILPALQKVEGVTRVRLLWLADAVVNGKVAPKDNGGAKELGSWSIVTEFSSAEVPATMQEALKATELSVVAKDLEDRRMKLYKAWDATKALEAAS